MSRLCLPARSAIERAALAKIQGVYGEEAGFEFKTLLGSEYLRYKRGERDAVLPPATLEDIETALRKMLSSPDDAFCCSAWELLGAIPSVRDVVDFHVKALQRKKARQGGKYAT